MTKPVFTINDAQAQLGVSYPAANTAAQALTNVGILVVPEDVKRKRLFRAEEVLGIIERWRVNTSQLSGQHGYSKLLEMPPSHLSRR